MLHGLQSRVSARSKISNIYCNDAQEVMESTHISHRKFPLQSCNDALEKIL
jgi:Na+/H+ antiporter NhaB